MKCVLNISFCLFFLINALSFNQLIIYIAQIMENKQHHYADAFDASTELIQIRKQELKCLYRKIQEYEQMIALYRQEKQQFIQLLAGAKTATE